MKKQLAIGLFVMLASTICYYHPNLFVDAKSIDLKTVKGEFYEFYNLKLAGSFLMTAIYSILAYQLASARALILKLILCYMAIMESMTFVMHIIDKFYRHQIYGGYQILITFIVFAVCSGFIFKKAFQKQKSDKFDPNKTFIVKYKPKDNLGIINYLFKDIGHLAIYQSRRIYGFKKNKKRIEARYVLDKFFENPDIVLKETNPVKNIEHFIGKKYNLFAFNCNHFVKYATGN